MSTFNRGEVQYQFGHDRITWSVRAIILANTAVFAAGLLVTLALGAALGPGGGRWMIDLLAFSRGTFLSGYVWTVVSYMFLHLGLLHLFQNMLMLYFFGPEVERTLGTRQFIYFYFICGIVGVLTSLLPFTSPAPIIGASGAVLGVLVAFAFLNPDRQVFLFPLPIPITARALVIFIIFINVMVSIGGGSGTSVSTHFGGIATGFVYMKAIPLINHWRLNRRLPKEPTKRDMEKLGEEIDNILQFKNEDRR